jgi:hypothetical protein
MPCEIHRGYLYIAAATAVAVVAAIVHGRLV